MDIDRSRLTPMMRQYFDVKDRYPDSILMYRLGDFYEMFFDDALLASKVLDIALTGRACGLSERAPMCGVPFHSVDSYIVKLIAAGYNVAVCEQAENPAEANGIVRREVVRVVTPGTIMDTAALDDKKNNYLCAFAKHGSTAGLVFADITTGETYAGEYSGEESEAKTMDALTRFSPTEIIMNLEAYENSRFVDNIKNRFDCFIRNYYDWAFSREQADKTVPQRFGAEIAKELKFGEGEMYIAMGGALTFLTETQKTELRNLKEPEIISESPVMLIDTYSMRNLEITETIRGGNVKGSLLSVLSRTETAMGSRMLRRMITAPLLNRIAITNRHIAVDEFFKNPMLREEVAACLSGIKDIERTVTKVVYKTANCHDLLNLMNSFGNLPTLKELLSKCESKLIREQLEKIDDLRDLWQLIFDSIDPDAPVMLRNGNMIKEGADEEIDKLRDLRDNGRKWLIDLVEEEKEKTGIKNLKLGFNKVFGYYIEVSNARSENVPDYFIRKQTLVNSERYITPKIKELEEEILNADSDVNDLEYEMFCRVRDKIGENCERVRDTASAVALIDVLNSLAKVAEERNYVMPQMTNSDRIVIKDGRHPVVEAYNRSAVFIPNDTELDNRENQIAIITGPNMAGKSTYMRQIALITLMAQMGSFVPASSAEIGIVDRIFTRVGASDDLGSGDSTFMVEMKEVAYILNNATSDSLIILDEIGRGTSTYDGLSIAWAVVEYIADVKKCGAKTLFATHYHELTELEDKIKNVKNYCIAARKRGGDITFLRKIIRGGADESYGVEVAALAGVKKSVIRRAKEIAATLEKTEKKHVSTKNIHTAADKGKKRQENQLDFFGSGESPVETEIKNMDLNSMTPMEALTKLYELQAEVKNS